MEDEDAYYDVEEILKKRRNRSTHQVEYLIKWEGYDDTTWEPEINLETIPHMLREFERNCKKHQKQRKNETKQLREDQKKKRKRLTQLKTSIQAKHHKHKAELMKGGAVPANTEAEPERKHLNTHSASASASPTPHSTKLAESTLPKKRHLKKGVDAPLQKQAKLQSPQPLPERKPKLTIPKKDVVGKQHLPKQDSRKTEQPKQKPPQPEQLKQDMPKQVLPSKQTPLLLPKATVPNPELRPQKSSDSSLEDKPVAESVVEQPPQAKEPSDLTVDRSSRLASFANLAVDIPNLKTDKIAKIIGAKKRDNTIYYAVLFKVRRDGTLPMVGVYDHNTLKYHKFEGLSEYLLDSIVS